MKTYRNVVVTEIHNFFSGKSLQKGTCIETETTGFLWWKKTTERQREWLYNSGLPIFSDTGKFVPDQLWELIRAKQAALA